MNPKTSKDNKYQKIASDISVSNNESNYEALNNHSVIENSNMVMSGLVRPSQEYLGLLNVNQAKKSAGKEATDSSEAKKENPNVQENNMVSQEIVLKSKGKGSGSSLTEKEKTPSPKIENLQIPAVEKELISNTNSKADMSQLSNSDRSKKSARSNKSSQSVESVGSESKCSDKKSIDTTKEKKSFMTNKSNTQEGYYNDEVMQELMLREQDKIKTSKRRQSTLNRRKSLHDKSRLASEANPAAITALMQKTETNTPYGRNRLYLKYIDCIIALAVCLNICLSIIDNEIYMSYSDTYFNNFTKTHNITNVTIADLEIISERKITAEENTLRFLNIFVVVTTLLLIYLHYHFKIKLMQADRKLSEYDNIFTSGLYKFFFIELFVCAFFYPPYLNTIISGTMLNLIYVYSLNSIVSFIVMMKCYIILRVYSYFSRWTSDIANSVCIKFKVRAGIHFAVKAELKKRPYTMLTIMMLISLAFCSFAMRTFEYGVRDPTNSSVDFKGNNDLTSLQNCFWLIIITMTTVGYGDVYPRSHLGRFVGVVACIIGMLLVSLIVVSLAVIAEFTNEEKKAYSILKKLQADDNAYNKAANVIKDVLKLRVLTDKGLNRNDSSKNRKVGGVKTSLTERFILITQLKRALSIFKNDYKIANSYSLPIDEMLKRLETKLKDDISKLTQNIKQVSLVDEHLDSLASMQDFVGEKMTHILSRQRKVADYIVKLNNQNYRSSMQKLLMYKKNKKNSIIDDLKLKKKKKKEKINDIVSDSSNSNSNNSSSTNLKPLFEDGKDNIDGDEKNIRKVSMNSRMRAKQQLLGSLNTASNSNNRQNSPKNNDNIDNEYDTNYIPDNNSSQNSPYFLKEKNDKKVDPGEESQNNPKYNLGNIYFENEDI